MHAILTSQQAKQARQTTQLSQAKVVQDLTLNRSYLSQFESGKYVFDDATLHTLRDYFIEQGWQTPLNQQSNTIDIDDTIRFKDGFMIPDAMDDEEVEDLLAEYADNRATAKRLLSEKVKQGFFGVDHDDTEKRLKHIQYLMSQNYLIIEQLHGHDMISAPKISKDQAKETLNDYWHEFIAE